jgi:hypothetical protein
MNRLFFPDQSLSPQDRGGTDKPRPERSDGLLVGAIRPDSVFR